LDELNATELLSVVSCMIFESRSAENLAPKMPSQKVQSTITEIISLWAALEEIESKFGVKTQREPDAGFCFISYKWASGNSLNTVLKGTAGASDRLRPICKDAVKRIDRGVVAYLMGEI
jgi:ATP-dependent RNA helicase HelY